MKISGALPLFVLLAPGTWLPAQEGNRSLHFAWPVPSDIQVTEHRTDRERVMLLQYDLEVRPTQYEGISVLRKRNFEILSVNGLESTSPDLRRVLAPIEANQGVKPDLYINQRGHLVDVETWDSFSARAGQKIGELIKEGALPQRNADEILELRRHPEVRETIRIESTEFWVLWVNGWLDLDFSEKTAIEIPGEFPLEDGRTISFPQTIRYHGPEPGREEYVRLSMESHLEGDEIVKTLIKTFDPTATEADVSRAEIINLGWVLLRPDTMQPVEAGSENRMLLTVGKNELGSIATRAYKLDWK